MNRNFIQNSTATVFQIAVIALMGVGELRAGELSDTVLIKSDPIVRGAPPLNGAVAVGYDTTYMFRGANLGQDAPWTQAVILAPVGQYTISAGAWYIDPQHPAGGRPGTANDELDLHLSASRNLSFVNIWVGYTSYLYPEMGRGSTNEVGIGWSSAINFFDLSFGYFHDFDLDTNYYEYTLGKNIDLNEAIALNAGLTLGNYSARNFHGVISCGLDFELTESAEITTFAAYNFVDADRPLTGYEGRFFGGVSLNFSF